MSVEKNGAVTGGVKWILRLEGLAIFLYALFCFFTPEIFARMSWGLILALFLVPDLSFFGYLINKKVGAVCYNIMHSYVGIFCVFPFYCSSSNVLWFVHPVGMLWVAHIGLDRFLGFGLKYSEGFEYTHLGKIKGFGSKKVADVQKNGAVTGAVNWLLRLEGLMIFILAVYAILYFVMYGMPLYLIIPLFFFPDLCLLGNLISKKVGIIWYDIMHSYITAVVIGYLFLYLGQYAMSTKYNFFPVGWNEMSVSYLALTFMLVWISRISFDRTFGFGFKYLKGFEYTHLGKIKGFSFKK
jgi:hypothetical protein